MGAVEDTVYVTAIGAKPKRILRNIERFTPYTLVVLDQKDEGWSDRNPEYKRAVLDRFNRYQTVKEFMQDEKRFEKWPVSRLTDDRSLFVSLYSLLSKYAHRQRVIVDTTAMPKRAAIVSYIIANLFENTLCIASGKKGYGSFTEKSYPDPNEEGSDPVPMPMMRRSIRNLENPHSKEGMVFRAVYRLASAQLNSPFPQVHTSTIQQELSTIDERGLTLSLTSLCSEGWIERVGGGYYRPTLFATMLGQLLRSKEEEDIKFEGRETVRASLSMREEAIARQSERLRTYPGMNTERIRSWLQQFPASDEAEIALRLLERVEYIDLQKIRDHLAAFVEEIEKTARTDRKRTCLVVLGSLKKGGTLMSYFLSKELGGMEVLELPQALSKPEISTLVFVDDCIISSTQSREIFSAWMGLAGEGKYVSELSDTKKMRLTQLDLRFHFIVGTEEGMKALREHLTQAGLKAIVSCSRLMKRDVDGCFSTAGSHSVIFANKEQMEHFRDKFRRLGKAILYERARQGSWTDKLDEYALGYGNWQLLLVFEFNTPSSTLPMFWEHSYVDGREWIPLFPRR